jgi:AcrR family transcriptional regulator
MPRPARPARARPRARPRPRWRRRPQARPEEILDAAIAVFGERGFARTRLDDVARRAGVSKGTLYLYFRSKDALFREVVRTLKSGALGRAEAFVDQFEGTSSDLLDRLIHRMWEHLSDPRQVAISRLVQSELHRFPELAQFYFDEVVLRSRRLLERVLARGVARGEFRPAQARFAARGIPALMTMLSGLHRFFGRFDPEPLPADAVADGAADFVLYGVVARPDAQPEAA